MDFSIIPDDVFQSLNVYFSFEQTPQILTVSILLDCINYQIDLLPTPRNHQIRTSLQNKCFKLVSKSPKILRIQVNEDILELESFNSIILNKLQKLQYKVKEQSYKNAQLEDQVYQLKNVYQVTTKDLTEQIDSVKNHLIGLSDDFEYTKASLANKNVSHQKPLDNWGEYFKLNDNSLQNRLDRLKEDLYQTKKHLVDKNLDLEKHFNHFRKDFDIFLKGQLYKIQDSLKNLTEESSHKTKLFTDLQHLVKQQTIRISLQQQQHHQLRFKLDHLKKSFISKQIEIDYLKELRGIYNVPNSNYPDAQLKHRLLHTQMSDMEQIYTTDMLKTEQAFNATLKKSKSYREAGVKTNSKGKNQINRTLDFDNQQSNLKVKSIYQLQKQTRSKPKLSPYQPKYQPHPIDSITEMYTEMKESLRNKSVYTSKQPGYKFKGTIQQFTDLVESQICQYQELKLTKNNN